MSVKDYDQFFAFLVDLYQALFSELFVGFLEKVNTASDSLTDLDSYSILERFFSWLADKQEKAVEKHDVIFWWYLDFMLIWGPLVINTCTAIRNNDSEILLQCYQTAIQLFYIANKRNCFCF